MLAAFWLHSQLTHTFWLTNRSFVKWFFRPFIMNSAKKSRNIGPTTYVILPSSKKPTTANTIQCVSYVHILNLHPFLVDLNESTFQLILSQIYLTFEKQAQTSGFKRTHNGQTDDRHTSGPPTHEDDYEKPEGRQKFMTGKYGRIAEAQARTEPIIHTSIVINQSIHCKSYSLRSRYPNVNKSIHHNHSCSLLFISI